MADGGNDNGFLSGELLLVSLGSCILGSIRDVLQNAGWAGDGIALVAEQLPAVGDREVSPIRVELSLHRPDDPSFAQHILDQALSGGVSRRLKRSSEIQLRFFDDQTGSVYGP